MPDKEIKDFDAVSTLAVLDKFITQQNTDDVTRYATLTQIKNLFGAAALTANVFTGTQSWDKGADLASTAGVMTLGTDGNFFDVTGTNAITGLATVAPGTVVLLQTDAACSFTNSATFILSGGANITAAAGDVFMFVETDVAATWRMCGYALASGAAITGGTTEVSDDTSPVLGGNLDGGDFDITNVGYLSINDSAPATPAAQGLYEDSIIKAWCNWSGGASPTIDDDLNISSLDDDGAGAYGLNYATAMASTHYAASGIPENTGERIIQVKTSGMLTASLELDLRNTGTVADFPGSVMVVGNN